MRGYEEANSSQKPRNISSNISEITNSIKMTFEGPIKATTSTSWMVNRFLYQIQNGGQPPS